MYNLLKKFLFKVFKRGIFVSIKNSLILAANYGQFKTANVNLSLNANNLPIPWYTYPAIEYLDNLDLKGKKIFEYGSGYSSLYYLRKGGVVTAIENNKDWYQKIKKYNIQEYILAETSDHYVERQELNSADIIVIDGSYRKKCAEYIIRKLKNEIDPYFIIFDNSDWYPETIKKLDSQTNWLRVDFCGFGPINAFTWVTSIYFNPKKKLPRIKKVIKSHAGKSINAEI